MQQATPTFNLSGALESASSLIPGGSLVTGALNAVQGLFGQQSYRVPFGAENNAAAPHRQYQYLDMSDWESDVAQDYVKWAVANRCAVEDIEGANYVSRRNSGHDWNQIIAWWRGHNETLLQDLAQFRAENPGLGMPVASMVPSSLAPIPAYQPSPVPMPSSVAFTMSQAGYQPAQSLTTGIGGTLGPYIDAGLTGAQEAITNVGLNTEAGKAATDQGAIEFLKNRWYIPLGIVVVITGLVVALLTGRRK